jgi:hypothetical protein
MLRPDFLLSPLAGSARPVLGLFALPLKPACRRGQSAGTAEHLSSVLSTLGAAG